MGKGQLNDNKINKDNQIDNKNQKFRNYPL